MVYELKEHPEKASSLFDGWDETLVWSCLQGVMGKIYVTDTEHPVSACAYVGCFAFYAGEPSKELLEHPLGRFVIMTPQNDAWQDLIERTYPEGKKIVRHAIRKDTRFDREHLKGLAAELPEGYEIRKIDGQLYDQCLPLEEFTDFVSVFDSREDFLEKGRGYVVLKEGTIVGGASSYTRYREGIEIEVDVLESERRKHLATAACATLILSCLEEGLYPSWDAANMNSVHLAEKLGYEYAHEYVSYWVWQHNEKAEE